MKSKVNNKELEKFVKNNPNTTLSAAGVKFGIKTWQVGRILKRLGYSAIKKAFSYVKANEEKRAWYQKL